MKKYLFTLIILFTTINIFSQTSSFDVFTYQPPEFFTKSELASRVQFNITNNDTGFCSIILYKNQPAKKTVMDDVLGQWKEQVVKRLAKANKKPLKIVTEQLWDGWASTLAIGNFYQNKKKCVVMLNSFRKDKTTACVVFEMSDKNLKPVVELFSKNLHLKK
ncbi:hypothetical protein [Ferruginibacter sp.]